MATSTAKPMLKPKEKARRPRPVPDFRPIPLPVGTAVLLDSYQICAALSIGVRTLHRMLAAGEYPRPDASIGRRARWNPATHNAWVASALEKGCTL